MHPFALASANEAATAIAAHADDSELAFIGGGADLIGRMRTARRFLSKRCLKAAAYSLHQPWLPPLTTEQVYESL